MLDIGFEATPESDPADFRKVLAADVALWSPVVKRLGLKIEGAVGRLTPSYERCLCAAPSRQSSR